MPTNGSDDYIYIPDACEYCKYESNWAADEEPCDECCVENPEYESPCNWEPNTLIKDASYMKKALNQAMKDYERTGKVQETTWDMIEELSNDKKD